MTDKRSELIDECARQYDNCLYTSTALFIWLRWLRIFRAVFVILPILLGAVGTWKVLTKSNNPKFEIAAAVCGLIAGVIPAVYSSLKFAEHLTLCSKLAADFKNLQDRFRQAALFNSDTDLPKFEEQFEKLMKKMESARSHSYTAPEWCFHCAQEKIKKGHYKFDVDEAAS